MLVRKAVAQDLVQVQNCANDAYAQYVEAIGKKPAPMIADFGHQIGAGLVHVAVSDSGAVNGLIVFFAIDNHMFLENVAVRTEASGHGIGKALIARCEDEARRMGLTAVRLYTNEVMVANLSLYPHLGYRETDRRHENGFSRVYFEKTLD